MGMLRQDANNENTVQDDGSLESRLYQMSIIKIFNQDIKNTL